ncbi:hypothetical protein B488_01660 [Liberibacter crescens BT-1]|uniref:Ancillary SecYEG translocon subunit/Cell division coordinator CpoB TPR domain-containing protein n=2 Tax=Liberibacter crescens TaxID=1273132 RepID=L0ERP0_LIBCB|nr:hypothetical protein B488_01660 [Liberibacter crescens BT-1]
MIASWFGYTYWEQNKNDKIGDALIEAIKLSNENKLEKALAAFKDISSKNNKSYDMMSRMYTASTLARMGRIQDSIEKFSEVFNDISFPNVIRDIARLHSSWLFISIEKYPQAIAVLKNLDTPNNPLRYSAREALGLAALKTGDIKTAKETLQKIIKDKNPPSGVVSHAQMMLSNIQASGK